jgi:hypothetical protein
MKRFLSEISTATSKETEQQENTVSSSSTTAALTTTVAPSASRLDWRCRVARYIPGTAKPPKRSHDGYINVLIHVNDPLSPYIVRGPPPPSSPDGSSGEGNKGALLENAWQSAKLYARVGAQRIAKHRMRPNDIVWEHPAETHVLSREPRLIVAPEYWAWRKKLCDAEYAVRYPNGFHGRKSTIGSLWPATSEDVCTEKNSVVGPDGVRYILLDYITARKRIYCGLYEEICRRDPEFARLRQLLRSGERVQIWEVDGPSIDWNGDEPFTSLSAESPGLDMHDINVVKMLLNDTAHSFGHGYTIAALLLHGTAWLDD